MTFIKSQIATCVFFFILFYLFISRGRGKEGEREGEEHRCMRERLPLACRRLGTRPSTQACDLNRN